jgi:hypothetical protein
MILLSKTYETWDEDALECGETDESGYEWEDVAYTFKELVYLIKSDGFTNASDYPAYENSWLYTEPDKDFRTGEETTYGLHFSHNNPEWMRKYWEKALRYCNIIEGV